MMSNESDVKVRRLVSSEVDGIAEGCPSGRTGISSRTVGADVSKQIIHYVIIANLFGRPRVIDSAHSGGAQPVR